MMRISKTEAVSMVENFEANHPKSKIYNLKRVSFSNFTANVKDSRHPELKDDVVRIEYDGIKLMG